MAVRFNTKKVRQAAGNEMFRRIERASVIVESEVVRLISRGQPHRISRGGHRIGLEPSAPGEPPKVLEGRLRASITHAVFAQGNEIVGRVGTNVEYARRLELGFVGTDAAGRSINQAPRPFLRAGLRNKLQQVKREIGG